MRYELFAGSLEDLLPIRREPADYPRKVFIYRSTPPGVYYVHSGIVRAYHVTDDGAKVVHHDFYPAGELFGESALFPAPHQECAVAHTDAQVSFWSPDEFAELAERNRALVDTLAALQAQSHRRMLERIERAETLLNEERLLSALITTAYRIGKIESHIATLPAIQHDVLGSMIGATRETVSVLMNVLRRKNQLQYSRREIILFQFQEEAAA
jgi:CRP/FNR family transcriptional regulator, cyclic AMP receptor protein